MSNEYQSSLSHLVCSVCNQQYSADTIQTFCTSCNAPLLARYNLEKIQQTLHRDQVTQRSRGIWRWAELLPVRDSQYRLTLGEGDTPLLQSACLGKELNLPHLYIKDEGQNPTGSFKARGLVMAVARGCELGVHSFVIPTAGNAGGALAAYAAASHSEAHIYMPKDAPLINQKEVVITGASLVLVDGLITDAAQLAKAEAQGKGWYDVSTFKEPYRVEGKKTMGLELAEAFNWHLPDVIIYPTGGGTGLVGMWKAFAELASLGWISSHKPRMVAVQAQGCAPIVKAFQQGAKRASPWKDAHTIASGLRVPVAFADRLILQALYESHGTAIAVSDEEIIRAQKELAQKEGILAAPEGAATLAGLKHLVQSGWVKPEEKIVLFNTGSGLKYL